MVSHRTFTLPSAHAVTSQCCVCGVNRQLLLHSVWPALHSSYQQFRAKALSAPLLDGELGIGLVRGNQEHRPSPALCSPLAACLNRAMQIRFLKAVSIKMYQYVTLISLLRRVRWLVFHPLYCCVSDLHNLFPLKKKKKEICPNYTVVHVCFQRNSTFIIVWGHVGLGACVKSVLPMDSGEQSRRNT